MHMVCVTIKLYMAQLYEVEWCRKRMQIAWKENKNSMYVYRNSKVEDWNAADGTD